MLDRARQYLAARSMQVMFVSWRDTVINMKQRKLLALEVDRFYNKKVYRRVYQNLVNYVLRRRHLQAIADEMQHRISLRIYRSTMETMVVKFARKVNRRQRQEAFKQKKEAKLQNITYWSWANKFRHLIARERHVSQKHRVLVKQRFFYSWLQLGQ